MFVNTNDTGEKVVRLVVDKGEAGMDWLQWSSTIITASLWPIALVVLTLIFRAEIKTSIQRLRKASIAGNMIDLSLAENEAQMEVVEATAPPDRFERAAEAGLAVDEMPSALSRANQRRKAEIADTVLTAIQMDAAQSIEEIWRLVEEAVRAAARRLGAPADQMNKPVFTLGKHLAGQELFTNQMMGMLAELRKTRNLAAANESAVTMDAAKRYFSLASRLIALLEKL